MYEFPTAVPVETGPLPDSTILPVLSRALVEANACHLNVGGGARHWVRECFLTVADDLDLRFRVDGVQQDPDESSDWPADLVRRVTNVVRDLDRGYPEEYWDDEDSGPFGRTWPEGYATAMHQRLAAVGVTITLEPESTHHAE